MYACYYRLVASKLASKSCYLLRKADFVGHRFNDLHEGHVGHRQEASIGPMEIGNGKTAMLPDSPTL